MNTLAAAGSPGWQALVAGVSVSPGVSVASGVSTGAIVGVGVGVACGGGSSVAPGPQAVTTRTATTRKDASLRGTVGLLRAISYRRYEPPPSAVLDAPTPRDGPVRSLDDEVHAAA
jgi:hypothetical protein